MSFLTLRGLLLQRRNYVERHFGKKETERLFFYMQESNPSTANIARIYMFLHGVRSFQQAPPSDSLRAPYFREGQTRRLRQFESGRTAVLLAQGIGACRAAYAPQYARI
jgi:type I restriction-modification system DNA methylase subunit